MPAPRLPPESGAPGACPRRVPSDSGRVADAASAPSAWGGRAQPPVRSPPSVRPRPGARAGGLLDRRGAGAAGAAGRAAADGRRTGVRVGARLVRTHGLRGARDDLARLEFAQTGVPGQIFDVGALLLNTACVGLADLAAVPAGAGGGWAPALARPPAGLGRLVLKGRTEEIPGLGSHRRAMIHGVMRPTVGVVGRRPGRDSRRSTAMSALVRPRHGRVIAGVCAGELGDRFGTFATTMRVGFRRCPACCPAAVPARPRAVAAAARRGGRQDRHAARRCRKHLRAAPRGGAARPPSSSGSALSCLIGRPCSGSWPDGEAAEQPARDLRGVCVPGTIVAASAAAAMAPIGTAFGDVATGTEAGRAEALAGRSRSSAGAAEATPAAARRRPRPARRHRESDGSGPTCGRVLARGMGGVRRGTHGPCSRHFAT